MFLSSTEREIRHLHVVVAQRRLRSAMPVHSCCFANIYLLLYCRSRYRRRPRCLISLLCPSTNRPRRARILGGYLKNGCVHVSAQRVPYSGTVPGYQVLTLLKPLNLKSDQHQISPCKINALSSRLVITIKDMITQDNCLIFYQLLPATSVVNE